MLERPDALRLIDAAFPEQPVVLTLGGTIREMLAVVGRKANHLYCLDSMGQPLAIGLGLAVGLADRARGERVVVVEGDGSLLMGFSTLATVGHLKPRNLVLVVLDNGVYLATGGQPTAARDTDFASVARACGWAAARDVESTPDALREALQWTKSNAGPCLLRVPVGTVQPKTDFFLEDPVVLGRGFADWLRGV
ncbi:MAG TPA: thiamine pyrophosphate-dependent enzyme [Chloroflexota bacterium]|nr:thiamine pyrophosphate-dependent enzyme [Chloroflexota bacterium]